LTHGFRLLVWQFGDAVPVFEVSTEEPVGTHISYPGAFVLEQALRYPPGMPRPRTHDLDDLLDVAEQVVSDDGPSGLTLRRLASAAGVSNGSIYHAFSSKDELLARIWLRAAQRFLRMQATRVDAALADEHASGSEVDAVVQAALTPVVFAGRYPAAARLFFMQRRDQLVTAELPVWLVEQLQSVQSRFTDLLVRLADSLWQRHDRVAVETIATCLVDLPAGLLRRQLESPHGVDNHAEPRIAAATRAILAIPLPAPARKTRTSRIRRTTSRGHT
jgi:AcrR family transcriptional regulator